MQNVGGLKAITTSVLIDNQILVPLWWIVELMILSLQ